MCVVGVGSESKGELAVYREDLVREEVGVSGAWGSVEAHGADESPGGVVQIKALSGGEENDKVEALHQDRSRSVHIRRVKCS